MAEPEELILEGAHLATRVARDAWRRYGARSSSTEIPLARVSQRLGLFLTALLGIPAALLPMEPAAPASWLSKLARGRTRPKHQGPSSGNDGDRVFLPPVLDLGRGEEETVAVYRLLAVQQGLRIARGSASAYGRIDREDIRDWFMLADAASVDRWIAVQVPGLVPALDDARADALAHRRRAADRDTLVIEARVRQLLSCDARLPAFDVPESLSSEACVEWAEAAAERHPAGPRYLGIEPAFYWGSIVERSRLIATGSSEGAESPAPKRPPRVAEMRRRPRARHASDDEDDPTTGTWMIRADEPQESVEDPFGLQRPADRQDDADPEGLADSLAELPEARVVRTPGRPREVLRSGDAPIRPEAAAQSSPAKHAGIAYPEWDYRMHQYVRPGAIVRQPQASLGDAAWVTSALQRHGRLVRRVRTRFERLRPRPVRLFRQVDGAEIDVAAFVTAAADRRAGVTPDGRVYVARRPARRELSVALLLDVSASTDAWVSSNRRIVDVAKEAMLIVCEALDALGDRYGLFAFSGEGQQDVSVLPLKPCDEESGIQSRRRIAALDSDRYTRLGAPIRHLAAALGREAAVARLLLLLSDGKPNDVDVYEGRYGVEDTRQAVAEARAQGITVFCLTIDREAPRYAGRIFGPSGFAVLRKPEQLPAVLVDVLRHLVRA
jgi:nitric oxide reductase NorD protein